MRRALAICALAFGVAHLAAPQARAGEQVVAGLSQNSISITAQFDGSQILIYGAVKREEPIPTNAPLQVIVTLEGPATKVKVRRKEHVGGIWLNVDTVNVDRAPSYYAVATSAPLARILTATMDLRYRITISQVIRSVGAPSTIHDSPAFSDALIRLREADRTYALRERAVDLVQSTLFRADFDLPANLREGNYKVRILLFRDHALLDEQTETVFVRRVGLERWLFATSRDAPALYGVFALVIAAIAGWLAAAAFRFLRA